MNFIRFVVLLFFFYSVKLDDYEDDEVYKDILPKNLDDKLLDLNERIDYAPVMNPSSYDAADDGMKAFDTSDLEECLKNTK